MYLCKGNCLTARQQETSLLPGIEAVRQSASHAASPCPIQRCCCNFCAKLVIYTCTQRSTTTTTNNNNNNNSNSNCNSNSNRNFLGCIACLSGKSYVSQARPELGPSAGCWLLDVGCWLFAMFAVCVKICTAHATYA